MTLDLFAPKKHAPTLHHGDCLAVLKTLDDASVDAVVTDPPYLIDFMGKGWDSADGIAGKPEVWAECLRVLKPGGHLLAFGATRTYHRMTCAIEDAGFEVRDSIHWIYGSGFPKSLNVAIALDKESGAMSHRGKRASFVGNRTQGEDVERATSMPPHEGITDLAKQWSGWGTALKPAHEPVVVARKPLTGTVAANVERYGTGALNIDASRVGTVFWKRPGSPAVRTTTYGDFAGGDARTHEGGRWPPNLLLSHTEDCTESACDETCAVAELDRQSGVSASKAAARGGSSPNPMSWGDTRTDGDVVKGHTDSGGASRFFPVFRYQAKASRSERDNGLSAFPAKDAPANMNTRCAVCGRLKLDHATSRCACEVHVPAARASLEGAKNSHPTVKPIALMEWLVTLVTPPGGVVLDPFMGSGTTGVAAVRKGFRFVGIEREDEYLAIARARIEAA